MKFITTVLLFILLQISDRRIKASSCGQLGTIVVPLLTSTHTTHQWPWHVAIFHQNHQSSSAYQCGGTLISPTAILTAAHCVAVDKEQVTVSLGRVRLNASESDAPILKVSQLIQHPEFDTYNFQHDIAIILLSTRVKYNYYVRPVCLWREDQIDYSDIVGKYGTVIGWGRTETGEVSNELRQATFPVVNFTTCLTSHRDLFGRFLSNTNFCAGHRNGTSVCTGDSGGSMTFEANGTFYIRGIVSIGASKEVTEAHKIVCDPMQYAVFTDVVPHLSWIRSLVNIMECEDVVICRWSEDNHCCIVDLERNTNTTECQVIFDESPNTDVTKLAITGRSEVVPELSDAIEKFEYLDSLILREISLQVVQRDRLTSFMNITKLDLSFNSISEFDAADTFNDLSNLKELDISSNQLTELHYNLFKDLKSLQILRLDENSLNNLPANIFHSNSKMRRLFLNTNELTELHDDLFAELVNLEVLNVYQNRLRVLPSRIFRNNWRLRDLDLSNNQLVEVHADLFKDLFSLEEIHLYDNQLETIPSGLFRNNINLKIIHLNPNQLRELNVDQFKILFSLEILWLSHNKLETLPLGLFRSNEKLRELYLSDNQLRELHADLFEELSSLSMLELSRNKLETLPGRLFHRNVMLREVRLSNNLLKEIHGDIFRWLYNLEVIYLDYNQLETIPSGLFRDNGRLTVISLSFNKIKKIERDFSRITSSVTNLGLSGNVCIDERCDFANSCDDLSRIFNKIQQYC